MKYPALSDDNKKTLEGTITKEEVIKALHLLAFGKSSGHDSFSVEFLKAFLSKLVDPMLTMFNYATKTGRLPESLEQVLITVLLKPGKNPKLCSSYRPISILKREYKILALRLLPDHINKDQTGLIQNRYSTDNVRRFF